MNDLWEFYKDAGDKWRWRRTAQNGNIVGASTEGYSNRSDCDANARRNGWESNELQHERGDVMTQKEIASNKIYDLYKEQGNKDSEDFMHWLEVQRVSNDTFRKKQARQIKSLLYALLGASCIVIAVLLMMLMKKDLPLDLSEQTMSRLKGMMVVVLDPKADEKVVVFGDTHFDFGESDLSLSAKMELDKDVQSLKENANINVRMAGYTSATGTEEVNQKLSEQRANAVRNYLIEKGIAPERITVIGYGRTKPAVYELTPGDINSNEAMANMRVLFEVVVK
jgi:outer membrane protein OmpA-like peptidoglycan-associated protein